MYQLVYNKVFCVDTIENLPNEEWREIEGTDGKYFVSNRGRVKSYCSYNAIIVEPATVKGYKRLQIMKNGLKVNKFVHRLVASCFLEPPPSIDYQLHHQNGDRTDNNVDNLEWLSQEEHLKIHNGKE